jgi:hypothetical protein
LPRFAGRLFVCNNCWSEPWVRAAWKRTRIRPVWLACDPAWHDFHGRQALPDWIDAWHWSPEICARYGYRYIEGVWLSEGHVYPQKRTPKGPVGGLWLADSTRISLNHCSAAQLLNLALNQYGCSEAVLVGHDFHYDGPQRHYFDNLSDVPGEYPAPLRKHSLFDKGGQQHDLMTTYREISATPDCPPIWNATEGSKLPWFPRRDLKDFLHGA